MTDKRHRPGEGGRGDAGDLLVGVVGAEGIPWQLRRRRAASWRCEPLPGGSRDPWVDRRSGCWTAAEVDSWRNTAEYLRAHQLYGRWQVPESVRASWRRGGDVV